MSDSRQSSMLRLTQLNAENLFLFLDEDLPSNWRELQEPKWQALSKASVLNKPLKKTLALAKSVQKIDPDILALNEVGGLESLRNFNHYFLDDNYVEFLVEGNSDRGIDVGYLVHKRVKKRCEIRSHRERPLDFIYPHEENLRPKRASHLFSRDCVELHMYGEAKEEPEFIFLLVHLKSKLDRAGIDPSGRLRRAAEMEALVRIYQESQSEFQQAKRVVFGDFNGVARMDDCDPEFEILYKKTDLRNALELAGVEKEFATTQVQFSRCGKRSLLQLDYIFVDEKLRGRIVAEETYVYRFVNDQGVHSQLPQTFEQKLQLPSDHYPVVVTLVG